MAPNTPAAGITPPFSSAALALITAAEGVDQPGKRPGGASGITLGHGYDLSAEAAGELIQDWTPHLGFTVGATLKTAVGRSGPGRRRHRCPLRRHPHHQRAGRRGVHHGHVAQVPDYHQGSVRGVPGRTALRCARGADEPDPKPRPAMEGDRQAEIHAIRTDLADVAKRLRAMERLWAGRGSLG